jgi:hypothetical protein
MYHCDVACTVTEESASAAADIVDAGEPEEGQVTWGDEWDRVWEQRWNAHISAEDSTDDNKSLGLQVCQQAKDAWRVEWDNATEIGTRYFSAIVKSATTCLLAHLPDLDSKRLKLGKRASVGSLDVFTTQGSPFICFRRNRRAVSERISQMQ